MVEIGPERLDCVDRAFAERLHTGCGRRIGIEQRELDEVPASEASLDEAARLGNVQRDFRPPVDTARKHAEFAVDKIDHLRVQLYRIDP